MRNRLVVAFIVSTALAFSQTPDVQGTLNGASFSNSIAPGSLISIFGTSLAASQQPASSVPLSNSLGGVTVQFVQGTNSYPSPMLFVSTGQINAQIPWEIVPDASPVTMTLTSNQATSNTTTVPVTAAAPGIFTSGNLAVAVNYSDNTLVWAAGSVPGVTTHGAKAGDVIIIYATGLGAVNPPIGDGTAPAYGDGVLRNTTTQPTVLVGGVPATGASFISSVLSPQFVGLYQVAIFIPPGVTPGNTVPLQIQEGGVTSPNTVTIAITN